MAAHQAGDDIPAEHREDAVREVDEAHHPHRHRQPDRNQIQHHREGETMEADADRSGERVRHQATRPRAFLTPRSPSRNSANLASPACGDGLEQGGRGSTPRRWRTRPSPREVQGSERAAGAQSECRRFDPRRSESEGPAWPEAVLRAGENSRSTRDAKRPYFTGYNCFQGSLTWGIVWNSTLASLPPTRSTRRI